MAALYLKERDWNWVPGRLVYLTSRKQTINKLFSIQKVNRYWSLKQDMFFEMGIPNSRLGFWEGKKNLNEERVDNEAIQLSDDFIHFKCIQHVLVFRMSSVHECMRFLQLRWAHSQFVQTKRELFDYTLRFIRWQIRFLFLVNHIQYLMTKQKKSKFYSLIKISPLNVSRSYCIGLLVTRIKCDVKDTK